VKHANEPIKKNAESTFHMTEKTSVAQNVSEFTTNSTLNNLKSE